MTQNAPLAVGLDIGTTNIVAVVGRLNEHRKIEVLGIGKSKSLGVQRGVVANITSLHVNTMKIPFCEPCSHPHGNLPDGQPF